MGTTIANMVVENPDLEL
ncbi:MAG TPA: hypothetical protein O0W82_00780, partial [Methanocorpusculum sp.]|nr:hypothetical protein [Methanocorpusculum sp.]